MLTRLPDWPSRLEAYLAKNQLRSFRYGLWDCALFVADAIEAMTGTDIAACYRDRYRTRSKARRVAASLGGKTSVQAIAESVTQAHGMPEVPVLQASRGDLALIRRPRDYSFGLVALNGTELLIALKVGFGAIPLGRACRAWRV